jgi:ankyrin repeat protein
MRRDPLVGEFIDAAVQDPASARRMLQQHPAMLQGRWLHGESPLHFLAVEGYLEAVRLLAGLGFDVNAVNEFGDSVLMDVAALGNCQMAEILLAAGANPNVSSSTEDSPLHCAVREGNPRLVALLLEAGADGGCVSELGETILDVLPEETEPRRAVERVLGRYGLFPA